MLTIRELLTDADITSAFRVIVQLRPQHAADDFLTTVHRQKQAGYRLFGGFDDQGRLVAAAGVRDTETLSRGPHLFVDDLVVLQSERGKGYGTAMLDWLAADAQRRGLPRLFLDSRDTAVGFYEKLGFEFLKSKPCWIQTESPRQP